jgi:hypothetical protein
MARIKEEAALWAQAGVLGLRTALLTTWDVDYDPHYHAVTHLLGGL